MNLKAKLTISFLTACIIPLSVIGFISLDSANRALSEQAFKQLESVRELKKAQISNYFRERQADMDTLIQTVAGFKQAAFEKLKASQEIKKAYIEEYFKKCRSDITIISQNAIIEKALDSFSSLFDENGNFNKEMYDFTDEFNFKNTLKQFKEEYGYYDLMILSKQGTVVYALNRGTDLGQNALTGKLKDTALGLCFQKGLKSTTIQDFEAYPPDENNYICFIAAPIVRYDEPAGIIVLKLDKSPFNSMVQRREGMGKTGETYIVGKTDDKTAYRTDRVIKEGGVGEVKFGTDIEKALSGESGTMIKIGSGGIVELSCYAPLNIPEIRWAMISNISLEEVIAPKLKGEEDFFSEYIKRDGYPDLFLIYPDGNLFYSVAHKSDYGTNLLSGPYSDTGLAKLFQQVLKTGAFGFADVQPYPPSDGKPSIFIAQPVISENKVEFAVAVQMTDKDINEIMQERSGMGKTGRTYLVGPDKLMRSDFFSDSSTYSVKTSFANPDKERMKTESTENALAGKSGCNIISDYRGKQVLSAYAPLDVWGTTWALIAEIDGEEALAPVRHLRNMIGGSALIFILLIVIGSIKISGYISKPVQYVIQGLRNSSEQVNAASEQVSVVSQSVAEGLSEQAASLQETSSSLEEIFSLTRLNGDNALQANTFMKETSRIVNMANISMNDLSRSMSDIAKTGEEVSEIIRMIDGIAFQTNILSLNASIEAARLADSGTGFAVVADEVKTLARRSTEAAKNTSELIQKIVEKISEGSESVIKNNSVFIAVAKNVATVGNLVDKISQDSDDQTKRIGQINLAVAEIDRIIQRNAASSEESAGAAQELRAQAEDMKGFVEDLAVLIEGK